MHFRTCILLVLTLAASGACTVRTDSPEEETSFLSEDGLVMVPTDLSLSVNGLQGPATKADYLSVTELISTQAEPRFRGMRRIRLLAFDSGTRVLVSAKSRSLGRLHILPDISDEIITDALDGKVYPDGLMAGSHAHLYSGSAVSLPTGTSSVLVYGNAPRISSRSSETEEKHLNGSLIEYGWNDNAPYYLASDISFSPDPIAQGGFAEASMNDMIKIGNYLTVGISNTEDYWYEQGGGLGNGQISAPWGADLEDLTLKGFFLEFISGGKVISACGRHMEHRLTTLYKALVGYHAEDNPDNSAQYVHHDGNNAYNAYKDNLLQDPLTYADLYNGLRDVLLARFEYLKDPADESMKIQIDDNNNVSFYEPVFRTFPAEYGLPDGAVRFNWRGDGNGFGISVDGVDGNIAMNRFCYMPPLYYFANTNLSTSRDQNAYENFTLDSWDLIRENYRLGKIVTDGTRSVALDRPLQFATAMLTLTLHAESASLPDNDGDPSTNFPLQDQYGNDNFPVTGIVIGSQYAQNFDFSPQTDNVTESGVLKEYFLYDNEISGACLTQEANPTPIRTLVFPTPRETNVHFFLEFENNCGLSFQGRDGVIRPGFKFYLLGTMDLEAKLQEEGADRTKNRVFMQDSYTSIQCSVSSLANAYLTIPSIGSPQLMMGVQTQLNWLYSPGSYVILE